jgi:hypothetical protein
MRKLTLSVVTAAVLLMCASSSQATAGPTVTIELLNPPPDGLLELDVGQSHTFDIRIESTEPFVLAMALTDQYYPGRGIYWHGSDRATQDTSALLHLTVTGKKSTADLAAVCDWPEPGVCWDEGVAPAAIAAGVRFKGGQVVAQRFVFAVVVVP